MYDLKYYLLLLLTSSFYWLQIWFQNKRARWRRRVNDNMNGYPQHFHPMSPMMSPVPQYGFMPGMHMMSSSPQHVSGYFNYPWMQSSPNNNTQQLPVNAPQSRLQGASTGPQGTHCSQFPPISMTTPSVPTFSSHYSMTSPQQMMTSQAGRHLQYPQFLYQSSYSGTSGYSGNQQ